MYNIKDENKQRFYNMFGKTEKTVTEDVQTVKEWLKTQPHLPEIMAENRIRNMLNLCKFKMDKVKEKIDNYYSIRNRYPDMFANPNSPRLQEASKLAHANNYPEPLDGLHRVSFLKLKAPNTLDAKGVTLLLLALLEIRLDADFMVDDVMFIDMGNLSFRDMCQVTLPLCYKSFGIYREVYSLRVHAVYYLNSPKYVTLLLGLMKLVLPAKIFKRIKACQGTEILQEVLPNDMIPKDYGGNGLSLDELDAMAKEKFVEYDERFKLLETFKVDEKLRPKK